MRAKVGGVSIYLDRAVGLLAILFGLVASVGGLLVANRDKRKDVDEASVSRAYSQSEVAKIRAEIADLKDEVAKNEAGTNALSFALRDQEAAHSVPKAAGMRPEERRELSQVEESQRQLVDRMAVLESSLMNSPEKALALPLLKQQISDTQDRFRGELDESHAEFGRLYTLVEWALGLIATIILGLGGFFLTRGKENGVRPERSGPKSDNPKGRNGGGPGVPSVELPPT